MRSERAMLLVDGGLALLAAALFGSALTGAILEPASSGLAVCLRLVSLLILLVLTVWHARCAWRAAGGAAS